jgi:hypothetical protein
MKPRSLMAIAWMLAACGGTSTPAETCATANPPDGGVLYFGVLLQIDVCGADPTCAAPICWSCGDVPGGGVRWDVTGNEACRVRGDAPEAG